MRSKLTLLALAGFFFYAAVVLAAGVTPTQSVRKVYTTATASLVGTAAYVAIATVTSVVNEIEIFDSSGQTLVLATGTAGGETDRILVPPGGNGLVPIVAPAGTRFSLKAKSSAATAGEADVNFYK